MADLVVSAVVLRDVHGRVLLVRKEGTSRFMLPGGKLEEGESPLQAICRESAEELGVLLDPAAVTELGVFTADAANEPGLSVTGHIFAHPPVAGAQASGEIAELLWLDIPYDGARDDLAPLFETRVLPLLT